MESVFLIYRRLGEVARVVSASRRPVKGACRVRGDRGVFDRAGRRLAETLFQQPARLFSEGAS